MTLSIDIGAIKLILSYAAAVHGLTVSVEAIDMARLALKRLDLIGKGVERDRRPSDEELERLIRHFEDKPRQTIPMGAVIRFAVATAMRQEEIFKVVWGDYAARTKMLTIRDRKDPREKSGNDQRIPLLSVSGFDPVALIEERRSSQTNADARIFLSITGQPAPRSREPAKRSASSISIFTTFAMKGQVACSRRASKSTRSRWSPATRTGRCSDGTPTFVRNPFISLQRVWRHERHAGHGSCGGVKLGWKPSPCQIQSHELDPNSSV